MTDPPIDDGHELPPAPKMVDMPFPPAEAVTDCDDPDVVIGDDTGEWESVQ